MLILSKRPFISFCSASREAGSQAPSSCTEPDFSYLVIEALLFLKYLLPI